MKIAYIGGAYIPSRGADSMHHMAMCEAWGALGHDVTLHARPALETAADDYAFYGVEPNFRVVKHPRPQIRVWGAFKNAWHVSRYIKANPLPDLLYSREIYGLSASVETEVPFIFESHWDPRHIVQREVEAWLFRRPTFKNLVVISDALRKIYNKLYPWLPNEKIIVAHDGANLPVTVDAAATPNSRLQVGYVGGFLKGYGIDVIASLARAHPTIDFHVVGGHANGITEWRERAAQIRNLTFHGFVQPRDLPQLYANFEVVLAPFQEGTAHIKWISPMKLFEYMAHGKAIICSDFPVMREIVTDGVHALLVEPADLGSWSRALARLAEPALRARLGASARDRLVQNFTWKHRAKHVLSGVEH